MRSVVRVLPETHMKRLWSTVDTDWSSTLDTWKRMQESSNGWELPKQHTGTPAKRAETVHSKFEFKSIEWRMWTRAKCAWTQIQRSNRSSTVARTDDPHVAAHLPQATMQAQSIMGENALSWLMQINVKVDTNKLSLAEKPFSLLCTHSAWWCVPQTIELVTCRCFAHQACSFHAHFCYAENISDSDMTSEFCFWAATIALFWCDWLSPWDDPHVICSSSDMHAVHSDRGTNKHCADTTLTAQGNCTCMFLELASS